MNDDTEKLLAEAKARLGLDELRELEVSPAASSYRWLRCEVAGHVFVAFGGTVAAALAMLEAKLAEGGSVKVSELRSQSFAIRERAQLRSGAVDERAAKLSARVRADIAAAKAARGVVS